MPNKLNVTKAEIFSLKYIIIMALIGSILTFATWIIIAVNMSVYLDRLLNAGVLGEAQAAALLLSAQLSRFIVGLLLSAIMLLITIFLFKDKSVTLFDYTLSRTQLGIILIIVCLFNMIFGARGYIIGGILGMVAGVFAIINDMYIEEWQFQGQLMS